MCVTSDYNLVPVPLRGRCPAVCSFSPGHFCGLHHHQHRLDLPLPHPLAQANASLVGHLWLSTQLLTSDEYIALVGRCLGRGPFKVVEFSVLQWCPLWPLGNILAWCWWKHRMLEVQLCSLYHYLPLLQPRAAFAFQLFQAQRLLPVLVTFSSTSCSSRSSPWRCPQSQLQRNSFYQPSSIALPFSCAAWKLGLSSVMVETFGHSLANPPRMIWVLSLKCVDT